MHLTPLRWLLAGIGTVLIGLSKTGIPGLGILAVTLFASAVPAKESVGLVLVLLICADVVAVSAYRRHAVWSHLWRLFPWTMTGVVAGWLTIRKLDADQTRRGIGGLLLVLSLIQIVQWRRKNRALSQAPAPKEEAQVPKLLVASVTGLAAGFTTMVANAAGPIMILYLLAMGLPKMEFVGTGAWYFLLMNCFKVPFSASLGLINPGSLTTDAFLAPLAVLGALWGKRLLPHIPQRAFELAALLLTFAASLKLLV
jgi:uncharacterized membrane protein YfcA